MLKNKIMQTTIGVRAVVYAKDVMNITGRSKSYCYRLIDDIKKCYGKHRKCLLGIKEFCHYTGLAEEEVAKFMRR